MVVDSPKNRIRLECIYCALCFVKAVSMIHICIMYYIRCNLWFCTHVRLLCVSSHGYPYTVFCHYWIATKFYLTQKIERIKKNSKLDIRITHNSCWLHLRPQIIRFSNDLNSKCVILCLLSPNVGQWTKTNFNVFSFHLLLLLIILQYIENNHHGSCFFVCLAWFYNVPVFCFFLKSPIKKINRNKFTCYTQWTKQKYIALLRLHLCYQKCKIHRRILYTNIPATPGNIGKFLWIFISILNSIFVTENIYRNEFMLSKYFSHQTFFFNRKTTLRCEMW